MYMDIKVSHAWTVMKNAFITAQAAGNDFLDFLETGPFLSSGVPKTRTHSQGSVRKR